MEHLHATLLCKYFQKAKNRDAEREEEVNKDTENKLNNSQTRFLKKWNSFVIFYVY